MRVYEGKIVPDMTEDRFDCSTSRCVSVRCEECIHDTSPAAAFDKDKLLVLLGQQPTAVETEGSPLNNGLSVTRLWVGGLIDVG